MEFLVRLRTELPADMAPEHQQELRGAERVRATELRGAGALLRLWRVPGRREALGLFQAPDATALHDILASLPMFPWQHITVEPLATHPQEAEMGRASSQESPE